MRRVFEIGRWLITFTTSARRSWTDFKRFRSDIGWHFVWGRFSLLIEDWTAEVHPLCAACDSSEIGEHSYGDESWTICGSCRSVEQGYRYVNLKEYENA